MLKVVLVDDEYYFRRALRNNIAWEENGFQVVGDANNGKDAFELICRERPDIAVVDINMPGYNGIELISRLRRQGMDCRCIVLSGYDEFRYAQQAIRLGVSEYVLKPVDYELFLRSMRQLRSEIEQERDRQDRVEHLERQNSEFQRNSYYNDLINCNISSQNMQLYDRELAEQLRLHYQFYKVVVFDIQPVPRKEALLRYQEEIADYLSRSGAPLAICCIDMKNQLFLVGEAADKTAFFTLVGEIRRYLSQGEGTVTAGIGNRVEEYGDIYLSYNEACLALKKNLLRTADLVDYSDIQQAALTIVLDPRLKNALRSQVLQGQAEEAQQSICGVYDRMVQGKVPYDVIALHTLELLGMLVDLVSNSLSQPVSIPDLNCSVLDKLEEYRDIYEITRWVGGIYAAGIRKILEAKGQECSVTLQVQQYIETYYEDPSLSISKIAQSLYLNYSYICYCFKRDKNITINDSINQLRIEKAKQLLREGVYNITYIAQKVGYENPGYFSRRFKRATGVSPSDYLLGLTTQTLQ